METKELRSKVKEFIGESVRFDKGGAGYFLIVLPMKQWRRSNDWRG